MSSLRKKSCSSTDESSSTSFTESTSSSCSSSGTDSGSSTSGSETSSLVEDKRSGQSKHDSQHKTQVLTRRKSSEIKGSCKGLESEKKSNKSTTKLRSTSLAQRQSLPRRNGFSTDDDISLNKKPTRLLNTISSCQKKKNFQTSSHQHSPSSGGGGKAPPAVVKQHHQQITTKSNKNTQKEYVPLKDNVKNTLHFSSAASSDEGEALTSKRIHTKVMSKNVCVNRKSPPSKIKEPTTRPLAKRSYSSKIHSGLKSSDESDSDSGSTTGEGSSSSNDTDPSETSNSSVFQAVKKARTKRILAPISGDLNEINKDRKLTRSLSTRRSKFFLSQNTGGVSETDSDIDCEIAKYSFSRSSDKKVSNNVAPCKQRKDKTTDQPRSQSPHFSIDKKCPIEGCDSSGHLSGNLDKHFLPEACPIFHNMSASECKERANDRIQREEMRQKTGVHQESLKKSLTAEQKDFLAKIRDSRSRFRPLITITGTEKIKIEKDCPDDDREPSLSGLVPDYDLQMFREAQAIASEKIEEELHDLPVGKGIKYITMGKYKMKVWYQSPYPDDAARLPKMYICEFCLRYQKSETGIKRHAQKCVWRHPPGDEIYRKGKLQVWQVDGKRHKQYCQHLCLLAKFFLDHKTLYYDVEPFLFYIMTLADVDGCHTVGYFSKEKNSFYNVSCILTLPPYQRKGYGRLLIDFSYLLTRVEGKIGSPEKPLSDLGLISYRSYWKDVLLDYLCNRSGSTLSIKDVSQEMAVYSYDIVSTLQALGMMKYWKGKHIVLKKQDVLDEYEERVKRRGNFPKIDDSCLRWSPFVQPQFNAPT